MADEKSERILDDKTRPTVKDFEEAYSKQPGEEKISQYKESNTEPDGDVLDNVPETEKFDVKYSCLRCGTEVSNIELSRLPEIKCICGFRVFSKLRPPIVKTVKAI